MGELLDKAFETPAVILTDGNQVTGGLLTSTSDDAWIAEPDAPLGSVHYKTDGTRQTRVASTGSGVADDWASENPLATGGGASVSFSWRFSTSTTEGDPGNARIRFDNATPASVTALFVDDFDTAGIDVSGILNAIPVGTRIYLQEQAVSGNFLIGTITAITDNTGWFKIELTVTNSGTLPGNNKIVGALFFAGGGGGGTPGDQSGVQARRTTDLAFTTAWADVALDTTDFQNAAATVEHDGVNTDRLLLKEAGPYKIFYRVDADTPPQSNMASFVESRVRVNDAGAALPGSLCGDDVLDDASLVGDQTVSAVLTGSFIYDATADDFLTLQIQRTDSSGTATVNASANRTIFGAIRMSGAQGAQGPAGAPGAGSTILVEDEGTPLATAADTLDFTGAGVTASGAGTTKTINIPGGGGGGATETVKVTRTTDLSVPTGVATEIAFDSEEFDTDAMHDSGTNPERLTINTAGKWLFGFNGTWENIAGGERNVRLFKNGATIVGSQQIEPTGADQPQCVTFPIQDAIVTDFFEIQVLQNTGGGLDLEVAGSPPVTFWAHRLS